MIPISLKVAGFLSYQEPVELDFTGMDLVCITGDNGAGKSSLLDAITWALFGRARKHDESVINLQSDAAEVTLIFDYEGNRYRVTRTNPRGQTKAVDFSLFNPDADPDAHSAWVPLTERTLRETDQKIAETLRLDYEAFINAAFFLQGEADQFTQQTPSSRKKILTQILGLEIWETYRHRASSSRRELEAEINALGGRIQEINQELKQEEERKQTLKALEQELAQIENQRKVQEEKVQNLQAVRASLDEQRRLVDTLEEQVKTSTEKVEQTRAQIQEIRGEIQDQEQLLEQEQEIKRRHQEWLQARQKLADWNQTAANYREQEAKRQEPVLEIKAEKIRLEQKQETLEAAQKSVQEMLNRLPGLKSQLAEETQALEKAQADLDLRDQKKTDLEQARTAQADAKAENPRLLKEMKELEKRIQDLESTEGAHCPLCGQALDSGERENLITDLKKQGKEMGDRYRSNQQLLSKTNQNLQEIQLEITQLSLAEKQLRNNTRAVDQIKEKIHQIQEQQSEWENGPAAELQDIIRNLQEESYALPARKKLDEVNAELKKIGYDAARHDQIRKQVEQNAQLEDQVRELERARSKMDLLQNQVPKLRSTIEQDKKILEKQEASLHQSREKLLQAEEQAPDIRSAENELLGLKEQENILQRKLGAAQQKVAVLKTQRDKLSRLEDQRKNIRRKVKQFRQLEDAFGKNGIPALLIEQTLPQIEQKANQILDRLSSGQMSIRFLTQKSYQDHRRKDKKETLEIQIRDQRGVRDYEMYSGGESFRINFAIRLALSHLLAHRAGARLQTLVIDEGFGSQDVVGRQRLIEALNLIREDFQKVLVITHVEEIKDVFSTQLVVEKTPSGSRVTVV